MATFTICLDVRNPKNKKDQYNLTVRASLDNKTRYLNIGKMTEKQFESVFVKKSKDEHSILYRETCNAYITKCERIYQDLKPFDYGRFRELFKAKEKYDPKTLLIKDLFTYYIEERQLKLTTKDHMNYSCRAWCKLKQELSLLDITTEFLDKSERDQLAAGTKLGTINSFHRDLRTVINYVIYRKKLVPQNYEYPYGKGGHTIKSANPKKNVFSADEIQKIIDCEEFSDIEQRYARDVWVTLYHCNGINFADLLRMR